MEPGWASRGSGVEGILGCGLGEPAWAFLPRPGADQDQDFVHAGVSGPQYRGSASDVALSPTATAGVQSGPCHPLWAHGEAHPEVSTVHPPAAGTTRDTCHPHPWSVGRVEWGRLLSSVTHSPPPLPTLRRLSWGSGLFCAPLVELVLRSGTLCAYCIGCPESRPGKGVKAPGPGPVGCSQRGGAWGLY